MNEERDGREIFAILDDDYARAILEATRRQQLSAKALSEECGMSVSTVSRRVNTLLEHGLLVERTHIDPDGHHYSEYEAQLEGVDVRLLETGFDVRVEFREDAADRFTRIWDKMRKR
ncbi:helix-turn-helix domain-containing protein [Haloferax chudinovii]|uniref:Helix-turn-helix domain-containing protein n=1 Tax=Haloferax chudinovii TaxID=1109010 RepID=A0ABD5XGX2_9EURY